MNVAVQRHSELHRMLEDMETQSELYRPTSFWAEATERIVDEISGSGLGEFRQLPTPLGFFVPTYGSVEWKHAHNDPGTRFTRQQIESLEAFLESNFSGTRKPMLGLKQYLSGELAALSDYRVLLAGDDPGRLPRLDTFSESAVGNPVEQFEFGGRRFSRSSLNYLLGLALLKKHLDGDVPRTVLEIGGGFGTLGEVLAASGIERVRYIDLDIPPTAFVAQYYLQQVLGVDRVATYEQTRDARRIELSQLPMASVLCAWQIERLAGQVDLFVNFISFQEMEPPVVQNYLHHVERLGARWILLRNLREGHARKIGDGLGVETPIVGDDYLAMLPGHRLVERQVHPFGFRTVDGFHSELLLLRRND